MTLLETIEYIFIHLFLLVAQAQQQHSFFPLLSRFSTMECFLSALFHPQAQCNEVWMSILYAVFGFMAV